MKNKKNSRQGSRRQKSGKGKSQGSGAHVTVNSRFTENYSVNTANIVNLVGLISTAISTGMWQGDINLQSLTDMFRLYRVNDCEFDWGPSTGLSTAAVQIPSGFLGFVPFGYSAAPTLTTSFETPLVSRPTAPFGSTVATTAGPLVKETQANLRLTNADMPVLQGPGGGWLATQDDGTQGNFGSLFWTIATATAANTISYLLQSHFNISFKDLLDPALISAAMQRHPTGFPASWSFPTPGTPIHQASLFLQQGVPRLPVGLPVSNGDPSQGQQRKTELALPYGICRRIQDE